MNPTFKSGPRPNAGSRLRTPAEHGRKKFLETDATEEERARILAYCHARKISASEFLNDVILSAVRNANSRKPTVRVDGLEFSADEYEKLELLVYFLKEKSVTDLIRGLLQPYLDLAAFHVPNEKVRSMRFYLDDREHERVTKYLAERRLTARKYIRFLALRVIEKSRKKG